MPLIRHPEEASSAWLDAVLGSDGHHLLSTERIGTGQMSQNHRLRYVDAEGRKSTLVLKLASDDPASRATGVTLGAYRREIYFYRELAPRIGGPLANCLLAEYDETQGWFTLVLEDLAEAAQGDQIAGCTHERAELAMRALARVHAPVLGDLAVGATPFLNGPNPLDQALLSQLLPAFLERHGERVGEEYAELCRRFVASLDAWDEDRRPPLGLVHGDYRLDNLLFGPGGTVVVDWQTVGWGPALFDASYFIGGCLETEQRRRSEQELVSAYHDTLVDLGVRGLSLDHCWEEYRRQCFGGLRMTIAASMIVERTERGDEMFLTWFERNARQAIDLDAVELLPEPRSGPLPALRPDPADEGLHEPGPEALWNESWYFDAVAEDGSLGVYVRLGRLPNQGSALYTACICGPGRPSIMLVDAAAPLPDPADETQSISTPGLRASQRCERELERFTVSAAGTAEAFTDEAAPLRGETGEPIEVALDLVWETDGVPYAWRASTRYEIPCRVRGFVRIGEETIELDGPGQRDHSWGSRDWWAVDWMWSALHLDDGTHLHAVGLPEMPGIGVGYTQHGDGLTELDAVTIAPVITDDGLVSRERIVCGPGEIELEIAPVAWGALRLESPDGRISLFPRAMCTVKTSAGQSGSGWIEWNRVQRD